MQKRFLLSATAVTLLLTGIFYHFNTTKNAAHSFGKKAWFPEAMTNGEARDKWENQLLADPSTGEIPENIREKELAFAKSLPKHSSANREASWTHMGPHNVGGRTRGTAIDIEDENHIISGGVSGGLWNSADGGQSWTQVNTPEQSIAISTIAQDVRAGKTNIWYAGTGEKRGSSASSPGGYGDYKGDGLLKSVDGGLTWDTLASTVSNTPQTAESWDFIWRVVTDPSAPANEDVILAALSGGIFRSADGGNSWNQVLGAGTTAGYYSDIAVTSTGVFYATFSSVTSVVSGNASTKGVYRSTDGINFTKINGGSGWPNQYLRTVIGIDPSNENLVWFLTNQYSYSGGGAKQTFNFDGSSEWNSLFRYEYLSGNGTDTGGTWINRSSGLPTGPEQFDDFVTQTSYDMCIAIQPGNSDVVVIGGTNLYRSTDGFATTDNVMKIGGYGLSTALPLFSMYPNHHPDQHLVFFSKNDDNTMYSCSDGGVAKTIDILKDTVDWESLNNGYITTQFYTVAIDHGIENSNVIIGGLQDNGTFYTNSSNPQDPWHMTFSYDGAYCAVPDGADHYYMSTQGGRIVKLTADNNGVMQNYRRIDPIGGDNYDFINPFIIDPVDNDVMYVSGGSKLWRNDDLSQIQLTNEWDSISTGWNELSASTSGNISAYGPTYSGSMRLYIGTSNGNIYRIDSANTGDPSFVNIRNNITGSGYISCIAVDPNDDDKLFAVFSNYNVHSLHYSSDAGETWGRVGGNLEGESTIPNQPDLYNISDAPSCRYARIVPTSGGNLYLVGTSVGLFAAHDLYPGTDRESDSTEWSQVAWETIGNAVVTMLDSRNDEGYIVAATHGNGIFTTNIDKWWDVTSVMDNEKEQMIEVYPNPCANQLTVTGISTPQSLHIYDMNGKIIKTFNVSQQKSVIDVTDLSTGQYVLRTNNQSKTFIKQ